MFAPVPLEPVFTEERRIVRALVPRFREALGALRFFSCLFTTFFAIGVGAGGGAGGGTGSGILGADVHISILFFIKDCFVLKLVVMLQEVYHGSLSIVEAQVIQLQLFGSKVP